MASDFKPWSCGEPMNFPPMDKSDTENNKHWKSVADYFINKEKVKCEAWKDEVQNLLVFSGLFSAVVTALLAESYKSLQPDSKEALLFQLVAHFASSANNTGPSAQASFGQSHVFAPSASSKRVNTLWFLSLVLSLGTALVGITAQQWLREHLRPAVQGVNLHHLPALIYMQSEALDRFFVPHIFAALPLLLITSLIFFFVGMIDFLWDLNHQVAIPIIVVISLIFIFIFLTTLLPGLQSYPDHLPSQRKSSAPRAPCPYKSPQSWAFLELVVIIKCFSRDAALFILRHFAKPTHSAWRLMNLFSTRSSHPESSHLGWTRHAMLWLRQRDIDVLVSRRKDDLALIFSSRDPNFSPHHDTVKALLEARDADYSLTNLAQLNAVFQCFHDYSALNYGNESNFKSDIIEYIQEDLLLPTTRICFPKDFIHPRYFRECIDNIRLSFMLQKNQTRAVHRHRLTHYHKELAVRLTRWAVKHHQSPPVESCSFPISVILFSHITPSRISELDFREQIGNQLEHILKELFDQASIVPALHRQDGVIAQDPSCFALYISSQICCALEYYKTSLSPAHNSLLLDIAKRLSETEHHDQSTYLFLMAYLHVKNLLEIPIDISGSNGLVALLRELRSFKDRFSEADIRRIQERWHVGEISWQFIDRYVSRLPQASAGDIEELCSPNHTSSQAASSDEPVTSTTDIGNHSNPNRIRKARQAVQAGAELTVPVGGVNIGLDDLGEKLESKSTEGIPSGVGIANANSGDYPANPEDAILDMLTSTTK